jgi:hypothetical protein
MTGKVTIPFNSFYPKSIRPLSIEVHANRPPDNILFVSENSNTSPAEAGVIGDWVFKRGSWYAPIGRNRFSNNAVSDDEKAIAGINGDPVYGSTILAVLVWDSDKGLLNLTSAHLNFKESNAQF